MLLATLPRALAAASLIAALTAWATPTAAHGRHAHRHQHSHAPARGIDVSHYQGAIDWPIVARHGISFAYVKATEGVDGRDPRFAHNWEGARRAGIRVGAYHYFRACRSGRAQAENFLAVAPHAAGTLPPAVDLEREDGCRGRASGPQLRRELAAYLAVVERREHRRAVLYVTPDFYAVYHAYLPHRPLWRRSVHGRPSSYAYWQYGNFGHVAGVHTFVDLNLGAPPR